MRSLSAPLLFSRFRALPVTLPAFLFLAAVLVTAAVSFTAAAPGTAFAAKTSSGNAPAEVTATIDTYGVFRPLSGAAGSAELVKKTDVISAEIGLSFGVMFTVRAPATKTESGTVPVTVLLRHPSMLNPATGVRSDREQWNIQPEVGKSTYTGREFAHDWEIRPGIWLLQLMHGTDVIAEQPFKVISSEVRSRSADDLVINLNPSASKKNPAQSPKKKIVADRPEKMKPAPEKPVQKSPAPQIAGTLKAQAALPPTPRNTTETAPPDRPRRTELIKDPIAVVQVGAFRDKAGAEVVSGLVRDMGFSPTVLTFESETGYTFHVVVIGPFDEPREARNIANRYRAASQKPARVNFMGRSEFDKLKQ